ncbi:LamG domain-containing protein [bacterium]|nr:LamG domain-containing protein [bacterium]
MFKKLIVFVLGLFLMLCCSGFSEAAQQTEEGLILWYTFDKDYGPNLEDLSGKDNNGVIYGAKYVKSPRGYALSFDGEDDYVNCGKEIASFLQQDATLEIWIKASIEDGGSGSNPLIFGDEDGLGKNRSFNFRINKSFGRVIYEIGNGSASFYPKLHQSLLDGTWQCIALVLQASKYYLYLNGKMLESGDSEPIALKKAGGRYLLGGGWSAGYLKGEIDEIRFYNRALTAREIADHSGIKQVSLDPKIQIRTLLQYSKNQLLVEVLCLDLIGTAGRPLKVRVVSAGQEKALAQKIIRLQEIPAMSGRWEADAWLSTEGLSGGKYLAQCLFEGKDGQETKVGEDAFDYPEKGQVFPFMGSKAGISDKVMPPFTPVQVAEGNKGISVSTWGRTYVLGKTPFPSRIVSKGVSLLMGPVKLYGRVEAKDMVWRSALPRVVSKKLGKVVLLQDLSGESVDLTVQTTVEYDGFMRIDWSLKAKAPVSIEKLVMELPFDARYARYLYCWPVAHSGELKKDFASRFKPIIWLGDEERGMSWFAESDQNWYLDNLNKAVQVLRQGKEVVLQLTLIDMPVELQGGKELSYSFALQATPVKSVGKTAWDYRIGTIRYADELSAPGSMVGGKPVLQDFAEKGYKSASVYRWWDAFSYISPLGHEEEFRTLMKECHRYSLKVVPYGAGFLLSEVAPEYNYFKDEMLVYPVRQYPLDSLPGLKTQMTYYACRKGLWQDFIVDGLARLMDKYDVDGIYLDTTCLPSPCLNQLHGCGYRGTDGSFHQTYPIFATRELFKRIYTVVKERKPDGIVFPHVWDCMNSSALAFSSFYRNGEQLANKKFKLEALPLDRFRTEFMGHNWGVPAEFLNYKFGSFEEGLAISLLHDVLATHGPRTEFWRISDDFGRQEAEWLPYWRNAEYVNVSPQDCYASLYRHPKNGLLAVVSNLTRQNEKVEVKFNLGKLDLPSKLSAIDARTKESIDIDSQGLLFINLASQRCKVIWIR